MRDEQVIRFPSLPSPYNFYNSFNYYNFLMNNQHHSNDISRREFLKIVGISTATTTAVLAGCGPKDSASGSLQAQGEVPTDKMTLRENPKTKEKVSLLGYGCMR